MLRHIKNPSIFRSILPQPCSGRFKVVSNPGLFRHVVFQSYSTIFTTLDKLRHIYISAGSGILRILAQLDIFRYIKAYSEPMAYSGIFRTVDIFSQF